MMKKNLLAIEAAHLALPARPIHPRGVEKRREKGAIRTVEIAARASPARGRARALQDTGPSKFRQSGFLDFRITPRYNFRFLTPGGVAQLGERLNGIQEVRGSIPLASIWAAEHAAQSYQAKAISH